MYHDMWKDGTDTPAVLRLTWLHSLNQLNGLACQHPYLKRPIALAFLLRPPHTPAPQNSMSFRHSLGRSAFAESGTGNMLVSNNDADDEDHLYCEAHSFSSGIWLSSRSFKSCRHGLDATVNRLGRISSLLDGAERPRFHGRAPKSKRSSP